MGNPIIIVSFSSRKNGNCEQISDYLCAKSETVCQYKFSFSDFKIEPCGRCGYECFEDRANCPYFGDMEYRILDAVSHCKQAYFVVPNYCDYPCANFFIFNERSQCYFQQHPELLDAYLNVPKQFIVISNTGKANFQEAFTQHVNGTPQILFLSAKQFGKVSIQGDLMTSEPARQALEGFLHGSM